jgi:hypothetical protein
MLRWAVVGRMPRRRTDLGEEPLHLRLVREQLAVEVPRIPIEQDAAHVEHDCLIGGDPVAV